MASIFFCISAGSDQRRMSISAHPCPAGRTRSDCAGQLGCQQQLLRTARRTNFLALRSHGLDVQVGRATMRAPPLAKPPPQRSHTAGASGDGCIQRACCDVDLAGYGCSRMSSLWGIRVHRSAGCIWTRSPSCRKPHRNGELEIAQSDYIAAAWAPAEKIKVLAKEIILKISCEPLLGIQMSAIAPPE